MYATLCRIPSPLAINVSISKKKSYRTVRANYKITLITPGGDQDFECDESTYILDAAEEAGNILPYGCRAGECSACVARVVWGDVNQDDQSFLDEEQLEYGYVLLCVAYPQQESKFKTEVEEELF